MACFKEMNQECPPFCPPFLTVFVPLVKYRAAAGNGPDWRLGMNRFNKGKSQKADTLVIAFSVGSMALPESYSHSYPNSRAARLGTTQSVGASHDSFFTGGW